MSDFTSEQLKAMREGTTPGQWHATDEVDGSDIIIDETGESLLTVGAIADAWASFAVVADGKLAAAAPALVDVLIAEKQAHQKLRAEVEGVKVAFESRPSPHDDCMYAQGCDYAMGPTQMELTRILEGDNG
ncbi:hypothetical protein CFAEC_06100 [Corynebacterium faecale]|uniref:hypothetical protein n=1 Tax=Corynebacterium faecale TaxID=1758466 RepID=UPI0025B4FC8B|nr:hypothetical protein [Corynebacterium faecale]WJY92056.1 hypothetical protein CFAEC_06100 [Corynebacterium faecale]